MLGGWADRVRGEERIQVSGVYPHLTMRNSEGECGTGALVVWQGSLWAVTYAPHQPGGSTDKLYEVTPDLEQKVFAGSVGGTPANRMIHRESGQLLIGPYLIDKEKEIRTISPTKMFGRLTGNARHLGDPANKVYYATMEEGLYEVDVKTLEVTCLIRDGNGGAPKEGMVSELPGYHGKGLFSSQGRVVYANNGERHPDVKKDPTVTSGALAQWFGEGDWQLVRRNQFTEVTGPGGIEGNADPESDPVWAMGWDARSLILALLENKEWHYYRLPKGSHSYDGSHGWNTEWPRIREIGEEDLLATMHGTFWRFPAGFSRKNSAGISPRSNYLKVIGDFCRWGDRIALGCDDSAKSEFMNTREFKAHRGAAGQSNSNLWFVEPGRLDALGPAIGRGSVWLRDDLEAGQVSDPYLFSGYDFRQLHLSHGADEEVTFQLEVDREGTGEWVGLREITVPAGGAVSHLFDEEEAGAWVRLTCPQGVAGVTANFQYRNRDERGEKNGAEFAGIATPEKKAESFGLMRSLAYDRLGVVAATDADSGDAGYYELGPEMKLVAVEKPGAAAALVKAVRQPEKAVEVDAASVVVTEDGKRYRLPKNGDYVAGDAAAGVKEITEGGKTLVDYLGESLALGAKATASSAHLEYAAKHAVDGSLAEEDRWIVGEKGEKWIALDLGKEKTFRSIWVVTGWKNDAQYAAADFDLQIKRGGKWVTLPGGEVRGNVRVRVGIDLEKPVTAREVRLVSGTEGFLRIYEIAVFDRVLEIEEEERGSGFGVARVCREVATERDLMNLHGTFYEVPARNAQGLAKIRPVATHNLAIHDFCSHSGLLFFTGFDGETAGEHVFRSADGKAAVWAGVVDDLWKLGKPRGKGGPWMETVVRAKEASDPYLMTAYDEKSVTLSSSEKAMIRLEVDVDGTGLWIPYEAFELGAGETLDHEFPEGFSAYWVRAVSDVDTVATVQFRYE